MIYFVLFHYYVSPGECTWIERITLFWIVPFPVIRLGSLHRLGKKCDWAAHA